jgi:hypothetical protein
MDTRNPTETMINDAIDFKLSNSVKKKKREENMDNLDEVERTRVQQNVTKPPFIVCAELDEEDVFEDQHVESWRGDMAVFSMDQQSS